MPVDELTTAQLLERERDQARLAMANTLSALKADLANASDVRVWTRRHPWAAVGVAAATGFAAAGMWPKRAKPQPDVDAMQRRLAELLTTGPEPAPAAAVRPGMMASMLTSLMELGRIGLTNAIVAAFRGAQGPTEPEPAASADIPTDANAMSA